MSIPDWSSFDWDNAKYNDPDLVPGDPYEVAILGKRMQDIADMIQTQANNLRNLVDGNGWDSDAGRAFQQKVGDTADLLQKSHVRYAAAAGALGSNVYDTRAWAGRLEKLQQDARSALTNAQTAYHEKTANHKKIDAAPQNTSSADMARLHAQAGQSDAELTKWQRALEGILHERDSQAGDAAKAIRGAIDHDGLKNPEHHWYDGWQDLVAKVGHWAGVAAAALGVAALLLSWVPVVGEVLGALAAIASVIALACDFVSALDGKGTWLDVAIDVVGVLSFGAGRVLGESAKLAEGAAKGMSVIRDFEGAAGMLRAGGLDAETAWDVVTSVKGEAKFGDALLNVANGPTKLLPKLQMINKSINPKVYIQAIKDSSQEWNGLREAFNPKNGLQYFADMGKGMGNPLANEVSSPFKTMAVNANRAYVASQTLPLVAGWGNLSVVNEPKNWITGPDLFNKMHIKDIPVIGAHGTPFVTHGSAAWYWSTPAQ